MRLAWAIVAGAIGAGVLTWWLAREEQGKAAAGDGTRVAQASPTGAASAGPVLYRWRDDAGVVQVTDLPPADRAYTVVDVAALERRNTIQPDPMVTEAR